ncbi:hypothetical protein HDZ31DRAFT_65034 [Schizophyllum fasciatum]
MKDKVEALIGMKMCLLMGLQLESTLETAHILRRELQTSPVHKKLFKRLEDALGMIIQDEDGNLIRKLCLDSSGNQDVFCSSAHSSFDGRHGFGSGEWCLVPVFLKSCLKRISDNPQMSVAQWFPERTYLYRVHVFQDARPLGIHHLGPFPRTYEHLDTTTAEQLNADAEVIAAQGCTPQYVEPSDDPNETVTIHTINPHKPSKGHWIVRSHTKPAYALADTTSKLIYRHGNLDENKKRPINADIVLYQTLWSTVRYWFIAGAEALYTAEHRDMPVPDIIEERRRSERIKDAQSAPAKSSARIATKKRLAETTPVPAPPAESDSVQPARPPKRKRSTRNVSTAAPPKESERLASPFTEQASTRQSKRMRAMDWGE